MTPTERLAEAELADEQAHADLYDLLAGAASERPLPQADDDAREEEAA